LNISTDPNDVITPDEEIGSMNKYVGSSLWLFIDQLLVAVAGWLYWVIISKITSTSEIGQATTIYSLVAMVMTISQLGLEYPILKKSFTDRSRILGTALAIELIITMASVPIVIYVASNLYQQHLRGFIWMAVGILFFASPAFVARFALLGLSNVKRILLIDVVGNSIKFVIGYTLVSIGFGAFGVLLSVLFQFLLTAAATLFVASKAFSFKLGNIAYFKEIFRDALANMPSKLSRILIFSLSIVLLASFGISSSEVGIFYLALMVSLVAAGLTTSMAYMIIPTSSASMSDLSSGSLRISLSLTAPLIATLIVAPKVILSMIGPQYVSAQTILLVLSIGILPSCTTLNTISKFNNLGKSKKLISLGSVEILTFLISFLFLVPHYGTLGAAFSTLIAFICSSILSIVWSEQIIARYILICIAAIVAGILASRLVDLAIGIHPLAEVLVSIGITSMVIITLKNTSTSEIGHIAKAIIYKSKTHN
jgi:O-antigen/teichoic acid export membrane protein